MTKLLCLYISAEVPLGEEVFGANSMTERMLRMQKLVEAFALDVAALDGIMGYEASVITPRRRGGNRDQLDMLAGDKPKDEPTEDTVAGITVSINDTMVSVSSDVPVEGKVAVSAEPAETRDELLDVPDFLVRKRADEKANVTDPDPAG